MRVRYRGLATPWFDYLFATPDELAPLLAGTAWRLEHVERRWTSRARGAPATLRSCATPARAARSGGHRATGLPALAKLPVRKGRPGLAPRPRAEPSAVRDTLKSTRAGRAGPEPGTEGQQR